MMMDRYCYQCGDESGMSKVGWLGLGLGLRANFLLLLVGQR